MTGGGAGAAGGSWKGAGATGGGGGAAAGPWVAARRSWTGRACPMRMAAGGAAAARPTMTGGGAGAFFSQVTEFGSID